MLHAVIPSTNITRICDPFMLQQSSVAALLSCSKCPFQMLRNQDQLIDSFAPKIPQSTSEQTWNSNLQLLATQNPPNHDSELTLERLFNI